MQILKLMGKRASFCRIFTKRPHIVRTKTILHKLGNRRLNFADIPRFADIALHNAKRLFTLRRNPAQHKALARIIQNRSVISSCLLKNPVRKPSETQHINIHNALIGVQFHKLKLRLHRKLVRHYNQIIDLRIFQGLLNHSLI